MVFVQLIVGDSRCGGGLGELGELEGGEFAATEGEHTGDPQRMGSFAGTFGTRTAVIETLGAFVAETGKPLVGGAFRDTKDLGDLANGLVEINGAADHFRPTPRGEFGLTMRVHVAAVSGEVLLSQPHLST